MVRFPVPETGPAGLSNVAIPTPRARKLRFPECTKWEPLASMVMVEMMIGVAVGPKGLLASSNIALHEKMAPVGRIMISLPVPGVAGVVMKVPGLNGSGAMLFW